MKNKALARQLRDNREARYVALEHEAEFAEDEDRREIAALELVRLDDPRRDP